MELDWPLVGRTEEMALVLRRLRARRGGIVLAGSAGVGKTRLCADCLDVAVGEGFTALRVAGTQAASDLPLGSFAPLLPDLEPGTDRGETLRRIALAIVARGSGAPIVLFVDDAHLLDDTSAVLTYQLAASGTVFVLASVRSGAAAPDPIVALWKDGIATRIELDPFDQEHVGELLGQVLGRPVSIATQHLLFERSAGNALYLRELVTSALDAGAFRESGGMLHLAEGLVPSARLVELVEARLSGLSRDNRRALELVALGEPIRLQAFTAMVGEEAIDELERRQLIQISGRAQQVSVRLAHPMYGEILRLSLSHIRSRELYRTLAEAFETPSATSVQDDDVLRLATWRLRGGGRVLPSTMLMAARRAWTLHDAPLAEELALSAVEAGAGLDAQLLLATVLSGTGRGLAAEELLAGLVDSASDDEERTALACRRMDNLSFVLGRLQDAVDVSEQAQESVRDPARRDEIVIHRASLLSLSGRSAEAARTLAPLLETAEGPAFVWSARVAAYMAAQRGQCGEALNIADRGHAAHLRLTAPVGFDRSVHKAVRVLALTYAGHLREAEQLARMTYHEGATEGSTEAQITMGSSLCITLVVQGRIATAIRWGREAAALSRASGQTILLRVALGRLTEALALGGQVAEALRAFEEMGALTPSVVRFGEADFARARAWVEAARGDLPAARHHLARACELAVDTENVVAEAQAHHDLVRLGDKSHAGICAALAAQIEGPLPKARAVHAQALATRDPDSLIVASQEFEEIGANLLAAEAAAEAAAVLERRGSSRLAVGQSHRAGLLAARCEGGQTPALAAATEVRGTLSARQLEIATLAAAGLANKEIAERLCLSVRTIENKLHSAYHLLGVSGRTELSDALFHR